MGAQPFQRPVVVVPDIADRLPVSICNFAEAIPFEEVKLQCLLLILCELIFQTIANRFSVNRFCGRLLRGRRHPLFVKLFGAIVLSKIQIASPVDRAMIRHLNDPG